MQSCQPKQAWRDHLVGELLSDAPPHTGFRLEGALPFPKRSAGLANGEANQAELTVMNGSP
jgi:hypothetical protein